MHARKGECMKRKFAAALSGALMLAACAFGLAACGERPHEHSLQHHDAVAATCTQEGTVEYWSCEGCGKNFSDEGAAEELTSLTVPALGHAWNEGEQTTAPTCTEEGVQTYACTRCTEQRTEPIAALGHTWDEGKQTKAPTCTEEGVRTYTCTVCDAPRTEPIATVGHEWSEAWQYDPSDHWHPCLYGCTAQRDAASHTFDGRTCTVCGYILPETEGLEFAPTADGYSLEGRGTATGAILVVPDEYMGRPVTEIGFIAFIGDETLEQIVLPASVRTISSGAFSRCENLESVTFAEGSTLTSIEGGAFEGCLSLKKFALPASVTSIEAGAFPLGGALEYRQYGNGLYLGPEENPYRFLISAADTGIETCMVHDDAYLIVCSAFSGCSRLRSVTFGQNSSLAMLGTENDMTGVFEECSSLESIELPASLTKIAASTFRESGLRSVVIPGSVEVIEGSAFEGCTSLESVVFSSDGLKEVWYGAFDGCTSLNELELPATLERIESYAFSETALTAVHIPASLTLLSNSAFYNCAQLSSVTFAAQSALAQIDAYAFFGCSALTEIGIPASVTAIGERAFQGSGLLSVTIPATVQTLGDRAFMQSDLERAVFAADSPITTIGQEMFSGCASLAEVTYPAGLRMIDGGAFQDCVSLREIVIPAGLEVIVFDAFYGCGGVQSISVEEGNEIYSSAGNCLIRRSDQGDVLMTGCATSVIPEGVTAIGDYAFFNCVGLTEIVIPEGVLKIGESAFAGCAQLSAVTFADSVTRIGSSAFSGCTALETASFGQESSLFELRSGAFADSGLTTIILPATLGELGGGAFAGCPLEAAYYCGTQAEWEANFYDPYLAVAMETLYFYSESEPSEAGNFWHYDDVTGKPVAWTMREEQV